ncbi:DUF3035 domain-containing protein [Caulobacter sp. 17J80-11]|uniref:DUF3035 domain-containing protein n=1 Tax=Caulobacter sp. 17J80-11 TaxID=2763502 RepID=UPI0016537889|nr:DUF3035 domain-containing protein [Caulobacter sp. 17J80-11]MBC6981018.1 DUF3035 domain-containing protein [Caulobacter sp. 17J80-11]
MNINRVITVAILTAAALGATACQSTRQALGMTKVTPDEFRVVSKAPLVVPPDFALRPPTPGEPRPEELQPESSARQVLLGQRQNQMRSEGEKLLAAKAGADKADPLARYVVDDENGDLAYKEKSFADKVLFWKNDKGEAAQPTESADPVDAAKEAERVKGLTGGQPVVIAKKENKLKLPGL